MSPLSRSIIPGKNACVVTKTPVKFVSIVSRQAFNGRSTTARPAEIDAALFTKISGDPCSARTASAISSIAFGAF